ncbi:MAG: M3 family metallopeptidase [bacterium]
MKHYFFVLLLFLSSCRFLNSSEKVINMEIFEKIITGNFKDLNGVATLFPSSIDDVKNRVEHCKKIALDGLKNILSIKPELRNFDNTVRALDDLENKYSVGAHSIENFELVCPDNGIREACHNAALELSQFAVETFFNKDIYRAFNEYLQNQGKSETLNEEEVYFIQEAIKDYKRSGFDLPQDKFEKVKELKKEISQLGLEFDKNINTDKSFIEVEEKDLTGMEQDFIDALGKTADGKIILKCDYPTYFGVMQNCSNQDLRKKFYFLFQNRAYPKNIDILNSIINKRDELAKQLGFESYAALDLDSEMAKTPERSRKFLDDLASKTMIKMKREFDVFAKNLPESVSLDEDEKMNPWDYSFVKESYKKKYFDIDERKIAEYFPVDNTINKIFEIYQKFLSLKFETVSIDGLWDKDVKVVRVYDKDGKDLKGILFLDLYPRDNKYSHACMIDLIPTYKYKDKNIPSVIMVIANFPKATKDKPALLKHNDVETFFHEFGHAMHGLLGKTEMAGFSGTNVKRDFVEMPSQMFEEWLWDKDILKMVSRHYRTGECLPDDIIDKKIELKKFDSGYFVTRQCVLSMISLDYFSAGENKDTDEIQKDLYEKYLKHVRFEPNAHFQAAFGHLIGYAAKYYGYMWSKVFALDMFYKVKKEGLLNPAAGNNVIKLALSRGGSVDPDIILKEFLGREPNQEAFFKRSWYLKKIIRFLIEYLIVGVL